MKRSLVRPEFLFLTASFLPALLPLELSAQIPAFPGAEGFGSTTPGGRGGRVIKVINLKDSGPGSFREALTASGPRIVVFDVGGTISLNKAINIENPNLTIAGQTAPGDGIAIKDHALYIYANDVIVRGLRVRVGDSTKVERPDDRDGISVRPHLGGGKNVIIDHCSISWAIDENTSAEGANVTWSWNIISEALNNSIHRDGDHSMGSLVAGATNISFHHNLFAHNAGRNPIMTKNTQGEVVNNVVYDWQWQATALRLSKVNVEGNHYITGPTWDKKKKGVWIRESSAYLKDNIGPGRPANTGSEWGVASLSEQVSQSSSPVIPMSNVTINDVDTVKDLVLGHAGAIAPKRDAVDRRVVQQVLNGTGGVIDSQSDVGGWPNYNGAAPLRDKDNDGMPDDWETTNGLNPDNSTDANGDLDGDGYTNIEEYINSLIPSRGIAAPTGLRIIGKP